MLWGKDLWTENGGLTCGVKVRDVTKCHQRAEMSAALEYWVTAGCPKALQNIPNWAGSEKTRLAFLLHIGESDHVNITGQAVACA